MKPRRGAPFGCFESSYGEPRDFDDRQPEIFQIMWESLRNETLTVGPSGTFGSSYGEPRDFNGRPQIFKDFAPIFSKYLLSGAT